ncbi:MAG: dihydropteroate synthase [Nitriliruptorales bacterium]|nr:dihydropteroate synthase [Nitriliruptorales bacterium]
MRDDALHAPLQSAARPAAPRVLTAGQRELDLTARTAVMGIVNRTPDSFYDRGETFALEHAVDRALQLRADGAAILDIGGIKGGPGADVSVEEEIERVVPVIEAIRAADNEVLLSVDTFRSDVARAAVAAGADIVNDVTGLHDPDLLGVVADSGAAYVAMHHGGEPRTRPFRRRWEPNVTEVVVAHLRDLTRRALDAGVRPTALIVDPGHDFQKTTFHSLELTRNLGTLSELGFPVLVALSNKDFIGETLDAALEQRVVGSISAAVVSVLLGASIVRVHEVRETVQAITMAEAILGWREPRQALRGLE